MAAIDGNETFPYYTSLTQDLYNLSDNLHGYLVNNYPPYASDSGSLPFEIVDTVGHNLPVETITYAISSGHVVNSYFNDFYFRIHILPNPLVLGNVLSDQETFVEVWNAYFIDNPLASINGTNLDGITISNVEGLATYAPLEYRTYTVSASKSGPVVIDGYFTFAFTNSPTLFYISGQRIIFWSFLPQIEQSEEKQFLTNIIPTIDSEQIFSLRDVPRVKYKYLYRFKSVEEYTKAKNIATAYQHLGLATPIWSQVSKLSATPAGTSVISIPTGDLELEIGNLGVIYLDYNNFEVVEVLSFNSTTITFKLPTLQSFPACYYIPVKASVNERNIDFSRRSSSVNSAAGEFTTVNGFYSSSFSSYETFNSTPVISKATIVQGAITEFASRELDFVTNQVGSIEIDELQSFTRNNLNCIVLVEGQAELYTLRRFLDYLRGRTNNFYIPSFSFDGISTLSTLANGATQITVEGRNFVLNPPKYIRVVGDTVRNFTVTNTTAGLNDTETFTFTPANSATINNVKSVQVLTKVRSNSDNFEIQYSKSVKSKGKIKGFVAIPVIEVA